MYNQQGQAARKQLSPDLFGEIKNACAITWNEEDREIQRLAERSVYAINDLVGVELDLKKDLSARELVIERCRYAYNNAIDEFEKNFKPELSRLILRVAIQERKKAEDGD
ncbi:hypothetical protein PDQ34_26805 [Bacillus cereus]|nr:hypothetical protein [Bacillus cereus]MDA2572724.1 hypothetical protein [Bacillus cereus]